MEISEIVKTQREFYMGGETRSLQFRINALKKLQKAVRGIPAWDSIKASLALTPSPITGAS